jgi:hypothetical protein
MLAFKVGLSLDMKRLKLFVYIQYTLVNKFNCSEDVVNNTTKR